MNKFNYLIECILIPKISNIIIHYFAILFNDTLSTVLFSPLRCTILWHSSTLSANGSGLITSKLKVRGKTI